MEANRDVTEREKGKRGGGGKLSRSETVTVRLDPRLNYLCELGARAQRRTKSSFIEWAVETALNAVTIPGTDRSYGEQPQSVDDLSYLLWDVDEADRIANLGIHAPILMTHEEQTIWKAIRNYGYLWRGSYHRVSDSEEEWTYSIEPTSLIRDRLAQTYDTIKLVAQGEDGADDLPGFDKRRPRKASLPLPSAFDTDLDDDVPF